MLELKQDKLQDSGKEVEGKMFQSWQVLGMKEDLWERVRGLDSMTWKGCDCAELLVGRTCCRGSGTEIPINYLLLSFYSLIIHS